MSKQDDVKTFVKNQIRQAPKLPLRIASERQLAKQLAVSRMTVRQAMLELANEGWLTRKVGHGTCGHLPPKQIVLTLLQQSVEADGMIKLLLENNGEKITLLLPRDQFENLKVNENV